MQIEYLRSSSISSYRDCPWKYFLEYVVGFPSKAGKKAWLGTVSHYVLEVMANVKKTGHYKLNDKYCDPEYLLKICWERCLKEDGYRFELTDEDYDFCRQQVKSVLDSKYHPFKLHILRTEHQFEIEVDRPGFQYDHKDVHGNRRTGNMKMRGTVDLITQLDEDTIEIIDYKTGQRTDWITGDPKEYEDFYKDIQLRFYNLSTSVLYKDYKYRALTIIFTRDGGPFTITFEEDELNQAVADVRSYFKKIANDKDPSRLKKNDFTKIWKCDYVCSFGEVSHQFMSENGDIITKSFRRIQNKYRNHYDYPHTIYENDMPYHRITNHHHTICDTYYKIFKELGVDAGHKKLYNISIDEKLKQKVSPRNNYTNSKITKERLE